MNISYRAAAASLIFLALVSPMKADWPEDELSLLELALRVGDVPNCADLGEGRRICTWSGADNEYYTCLIGSGSVSLTKDHCIYEALKERESSYFHVSDRGNKRSLRRWQERYDLASKNVNEGSVLAVSKTVGHGPVACMVADGLICKWETGNKSPGHHDSLRYLAAPNMYDQDNTHIRLVCDFDLETLERTDIPCSAMRL